MSASSQSFRLTTPGVRQANPPQRTRATFRDLWQVLRPRRWALACGLVVIVVNRALALVLPGSSKFLIDNVIGQHRPDLLNWLILVVAGASIMQSATSFLLTNLLSKEGERLIAALRRKVQAHISFLPLAYHDQHKTGALVARIMNDVGAIRRLCGSGLVEMLGSVATAVVAMLLLLRLSPALTGVTVLMVVLFGLVLKKAFGALRPIFLEQYAIQAELTGRLTESLAGIRIVKGYHAEAREAAVFSRGVARQLDNMIQMFTANARAGFAGSMLVAGASASIMYMGARQIFAGRMTLGDLITFTVLLAFLVAPVMQFVNMSSVITESLAGVARTQEILREPSEANETGRTVELGKVFAEIRFEQVGFEYHRGKPVLHGISFSAKPGSVTALVGPSGSGKSTIIGLIAGFYTPQSGRVLIDGVDLSKVKIASYRERLGIVLQDTFLFDGTIRENVIFANPEATEQEILDACRLAYVDEFVQGFGLKYDTLVGERGVRLSGGQRQRISIARAILADPQILILDEATSNVDSESELAIQKGLGYLLSGRTTFVIAHRLSTIRRADQILVVDGGRIVERGTHTDLLEAEGRYARLYASQQDLKENLFLAPIVPDPKSPATPPS